MPTFDLWLEAELILGSVPTVKELVRRFTVLKAALDSGQFLGFNGSILSFILGFFILIRCQAPA